MSTQKTRIEKDFGKRLLHVTRDFDAPVELVWRAYSESQLLDQWWGPAPWRAETHTMDFRAGGRWFYAMVSPEGQRHWARMNYIAIEPRSRITIEQGLTMCLDQLEGLLGARGRALNSTLRGRYCVMAGGSSL